MHLKEIAIKSIDDLIRCLNLSSLLEVAGWPKPGNVHRTKNFKDTYFEHFLAGIAAIVPNFREFCYDVYSKYENNSRKYDFVNLGLFYKEAVTSMMRWQNGGNVLLGHILILSPLASSATICLKTEKLTFTDFTNNLKKIIDDSTIEDTLYLYEAIRICNPGGLGLIDKYDINNQNSFKEIRDDNITLKEIFSISASYDLISSEYTTGFEIILKAGLPYYLNLYEKYHDINIATVNTFLKLLSTHLDTLIIRKSGKESARYVSNYASKVLKSGGITSKKGYKLLIKFDKKIHRQNGELNPGTTADLLAGVIFCALLFGLKY